MNKLWKVFEYGYLVIAVVCIVETAMQWSEDRERAYLFLLFAVVFVFMYFFKKRFRNKIQNREKK